MTVTFSVKDGKDGGSLSGTLTQKVKPGETCSTVTATAKEGYSLEWGCTEGRIENVNNGTLTFTVPANTKLESISVWVTFKNKHTHSFGSWTDAGNGTHTRTCTASGCTNPPKTETENHIKGNWTADPSDATKEHIYCTKCGAVLESRTVEHTHTPDSGTTTPATCTSEGVTIYKCTSCGQETSRTKIDALGHDFSGQLTESDGSVWKKCTRCGAKGDMISGPSAPSSSTPPPAPSSSAAPEASGAADAPAA